METLSTKSPIEIAKIKEQPIQGFGPISITLVQDYPFPVALAEPCLDRYRDIYHDNINMGIITTAYTSSMNFGSQSLLDWAEDIRTKTDAVQIQIRLGLYTDKLVSEYGAPVDRLTAFLYPINQDGEMAIYVRKSTYSPVAPPKMGSTAPPQVITPANRGDVATVFNFAGLQP